MLEFLLLISVGVLFFFSHQQKNRISNLEKHLGIDQKDRQTNISAAEVVKDRKLTLEERRERNTAARTQAQRSSEPVLQSKVSTKPEVKATSRVAIPVAKSSNPSRVEKALAAGARWVKENWFYATAAACLALAGIYTAQYAIGQVSLPPIARIAMASLFGGALIVLGEFIRRRVGDGKDVSTAYLPSVFSGAGIVTLFGSALTAHLLYGMISTEVTLALLVAVAGLSIALGWFHGPLLVCVGIIGATVAPFILGGETETPELLYAYFLLISFVGLLVNAARKWPYVNELSLLGPLAASSLVFTGSDTVFPYMATTAAFCLLSAVMLSGTVRVKLKGHGVFESLKKKTRPSDAQVLVVTTWALSGAGMLVSGFAGITELTLAIAMMLGLFVLSAIWSGRGRGAYDLTGITTVLTTLAVWRGALMPLETGRVLVGAEAQVMGLDALLWVSIAAAFILSLTGLVCSAYTKGVASRYWAFFAAATGPGLLAALEAISAPADIIGINVWSGVVLSFAALATFAAERAAHYDKDNHLRKSLSALVAMSMIALSACILFSDAALSIALSVLVLGAIALDDRFKLRSLMLFAQAGAAGVIYRALVYPGIYEYNMNTSLLEIALGHCTPGLILAAAWVMLRAKPYPVTRSSIEGAAIIVGLTGISLMILKLLQLYAISLADSAHITGGVIGTLWIISSAASFRGALNMPVHGESDMTRGVRWAKVIRHGAGVYSGLMVLFALGYAIFQNPLTESEQIILGIPFASSLLLGYLLPALAAFWAASILPKAQTALRALPLMLGGIMASMYVCLSVIHFWRGSNPTHVSMGDPELWSYTVILVIAGSGLLLAAIHRHSQNLRRLANAVLILALVKAFLIDAPDLDGLLRAGSFLILGLALAGLAWINRRAAMNAEVRDNR